MRTNDIDRTIGTLCIEFEPAGHGRRAGRVVRCSPPLATVACICRALRLSSGAAREASILALITVADQTLVIVVNLPL